jgi:hypothetical protein
MSSVSLKDVFLGLGQAFKGIRRIDPALAIAIDGQQRAHQNAAAAAPDAGFDEVARNALIKGLAGELRQIAQPLGADHRMGDHRPVAANLATFFVVVFRQMRVDLLVFVNGIGQNAHHEIDIHSAA